MIDISFLKMQLFFFFETITASFQHLDQWLIQWMIDISFLKIKLFFFISKLLQHLSSIFQVSFKQFSSLHQHFILQTFLPIFSDPIHTPAPFQQCSRLNFCKENALYFMQLSDPVIVQAGGQETSPWTPSSSWTPRLCSGGRWELCRYLHTVSTII